MDKEKLKNGDVMMASCGINLKGGKGVWRLLRD